MKGMDWLEGDEFAEVIVELEEEEDQTRDTELLDVVFEFPGISAAEVADVLGWDKRTVLRYTRLSPKIEARGGRKGRGHKWRIYPVKMDIA